MSGPSIPRLIRKASEELRDLTGLQVVSVVSMSQGETGWRLGVELLEREAVPDTMDVLAIYDVQLNDDGGVKAFERKALRHRGDTGEV